jgi:hypothetical protein
MKAFDLSKIGAGCRAANPDLDRTVRPSAQPTEPNEFELEADLQVSCESFLESVGYRRLTPENCVIDDDGCRGYFGHLSQPKGNPLLPDLFIFPHPNDRPAFLAEFKVRDSFRPGQLPMIRRGQWRLFKSKREFVSAFLEWAG